MDIARMVRRVGLYFGRRCSLCGAVIRTMEDLTGDFPGVCGDCSRELVLRTGGYCPGCGRLYAADRDDVYLCSLCRHAPEPWSGIGFFAPYAGLLKTLVTDYKFRARLGTGRVLGRMLQYAFAAHNLRRPDVIVPVPLFAGRLHERGYNQSLELARYLLPDIGCVLDSASLVRIRSTRAQSGLARTARLANLKGAFAVQGEALREKHVLIVDDVLTTGATLRTCARTLLRGGAARVEVLVLARA